MLIFVVMYRLSPSYRKTFVMTLKAWTESDARERAFKKISIKHRGHIQIVSIEEQE